MITSVVKRLRWKYVSIIHTDDNYGRQGNDALTKLLENSDVCVDVTAEVPAAYISGNSVAYEEAVSAIAEKTPEGVAVIAFVSNPQAARQLLEAAEGISGGRDLVWIFSDGLGTSNIAKDLSTIRGVISVTTAEVPVIDSFGIHFATLDETGKEEALEGNPWYKEYFQEANNCRLEGNSSPRFEEFPLCPEKTFSERQRGFTQDDRIFRVIHAVYSYAEALFNAHRDLCGEGFRGVCERLKYLSREDFFASYLSTVEFTYSLRNRAAPELYDVTVAFDENGNIRASKLGVYNYQRQNGDWQFVQVRYNNFPWNNENSRLN